MECGGSLKQQAKYLLIFHLFLTGNKIILMSLGISCLANIRRSRKLCKRGLSNLIPYFVIVSFVRLAEKVLCFLIHSESFSFQAFKDNLAIILLAFPIRGGGMCLNMMSLGV